MKPRQAQETAHNRQECGHPAKDVGHVLAPSPSAGRAVLAKLFRAAGHPVRLALLELLSAGECNATACVAHVGLSQGRVATHLACLVDCGFIASRRSGRFVYYRITDPRVAQLVLLARSLAAENSARIAACTRVDESAGDRDGATVLLGGCSRDAIEVEAATEVAPEVLTEVITLEDATCER